MNRNLLFAAAFMLAHTFYAQEAKPVVVVSATGKVSLLPQGQTTAQPLQSGAVAKNTGKLVLGKKSRATLYCDGQFKEVSGKSTIDLSTVCGNNSGKRTVNADYDFGEKLMAAVEMVAVAKNRGDGWASSISDPKKSGDGWGNSISDPKKSGDGWGNSISDPKKSGDGWGNSISDPKKSGDGWGGKGSSIRLIMPFGKLRAGTTEFYWSKPETNQPYKLIILDESNKNVHEISVRDTFAKIDLGQLNLSNEQIYHWKILVEGNQPIASNELEFGIGSKEEWESAIQKSGNSPLSNSTQDPVLRSLVEAIALENDEWYYEAAQIYAGLQQKNASLTRMMHAAFWMRYGYRRLAEKAAKS